VRFIVLTLILKWDQARGPNPSMEEGEEEEYLMGRKNYEVSRYKFPHIAFSLLGPDVLNILFSSVCSLLG
jgi:hypothetical protein